MADKGLPCGTPELIVIALLHLVGNFIITFLDLKSFQISSKTV